jgi:16S rRNA processing protein RimM
MLFASKGNKNIFILYFWVVFAQFTTFAPFLWMVMAYKLAAKIQKTYGSEGELLLLPADDAQWTMQQPFFVSIDGLRTPFFIKKMRKLSAKIVAVFENMESAELAQTLAGRELYIECGEPSAAPDNHGKYYDYEVCCDGCGIGRIVQQHNFSGNLCFELDGGTLIPAHADFIISIDKKKRRITMRLPQGLL